MDGALELDPIDEGLGAGEFVAILDPVVFEDFGDVVGGRELESGFLGGEMSADFEVFGLGIGGIEIDFVIESRLSVEFSCDGEAGGTVLINAVGLEVIDLVLQVFLIEGAVAFGGFFFGPLGEEGCHEFDDIVARGSAAGGADADEVFAGVFELEVAKADDAIPGEGAGDGEAINDLVFGSAVEKDFILASFNAGAVGSGGGFVGLEAPLDDGRFFAGDDGVLDDLARSVVIEFKVEGREGEGAADVVEAAGGWVFGEGFGVEGDAEEVADGIGVFVAIESTENDAGGFLGDFGAGEFVGDPVGEGCSDFGVGLGFVLGRHFVGVDGIEDLAPLSGFGEVEKVVLELGFEIEFAFGFFLAVAGDAVLGEVGLGDDFEALVVRGEGGGFVGVEERRDEEKEKGWLHEDEDPGRNSAGVATPEVHGNIGVGEEGEVF